MVYTYKTPSYKHYNKKKTQQENKQNCYTPVVSQVEPKTDSQEEREEEHAQFMAQICRSLAIQISRLGPNCCNFA